MERRAKEETVLGFIRDMCRIFGARESTGLKVAAEFAAAFERGEITVDVPRPVDSVTPSPVEPG